MFVGRITRIKLPGDFDDILWIDAALREEANHPFSDPLILKRRHYRHPDGGDAAPS